MYGVNAKNITTSNIMIGVLIFFGGACQFIAGIMEFISGNTVSRVQSHLQTSPNTSLVWSNCFPSLRRFQLVVCLDLSPWLRHSRRLHRQNDRPTQL
jgi:hypothetical protein